MSTDQANFDDTRVVLAVIRGDIAGIRLDLARLTDGQRDMKVDLVSLEDVLAGKSARNDSAIRAMEISIATMLTKMSIIERDVDRQDRVIAGVAEDLAGFQRQSRIVDGAVAAAAGIAALFIK
jgi:hypothetical protein